MKSYQEHVSEAAARNIAAWLSESKYAMYRDEVVAMIEAEEWDALEDAFFKVIEFGTGGRRGTVGVGSNRINKVTIGESCQALCKYAESVIEGAQQKGLVIACDTRLSSPELSEYVARVSAANGWKTYIFDGFRATPELSFAVRHLGCAVGIVISASHNPPSDNGFKAYWSDGGQLVSPHDKGVMAQVAVIDHINEGKSFEEYVADGAISVIGEDVDTAYIAAVINEAEGVKRDVSITYSPLHGAGQTNVLPSLRAAGFDDIDIVEVQMTPDGNFPTVPNGKPNPEEYAANQIAVNQMIERGTDIAITNDPDADRIGVVVNHEGAPVYLTGNQSATLAVEYALRKKYEAGELQSNDYIAKTIVTTDMFAPLAEQYGVTLYTNMLIGFKYIGELILSKEGSDERFLIGGEESYGLLKGTYARDKDGATGALPLAEYAAELKAEGKTLYDRLLELYAEHGIYKETLTTTVCPGAQGFRQMQQIMESFRSTPPLKIGAYDVTAVRDYASLERRDLVSGEITSLKCISGNVIVLEFGDYRRRLTIRPSGTEPKLKVYAQWYEDSSQDIKAQLDRMDEMLALMAKDLETIAFARVQS